MKLIYVDDNLPGITRKRDDKSWIYYDPAGNKITIKQEITRLNTLAFPPAYKDVWLCPEENGHILATGYDTKGRKQYLYHPEFREQQELKKFEACALFGNKLTLLRAKLAECLQGNELDYERTLAAVIRLMDLGPVDLSGLKFVQSRGDLIAA